MCACFFLPTLFGCFRNRTSHVNPLNTSVFMAGIGKGVRFVRFHVVKAFHFNVYAHRCELVWQVHCFFLSPSIPRSAGVCAVGSVHPWHSISVVPLNQRRRLPLWFIAIDPSSPLSMYVRQSVHTGSVNFPSGSECVTNSTSKRVPPRFELHTSHGSQLKCPSSPTCDHRPSGTSFESKNFFTA